MRHALRITIHAPVGRVRASGLVCANKSSRESQTDRLPLAPRVLHGWPRSIGRTVNCGSDTMFVDVPKLGGQSQAQLYCWCNSLGFPQYLQISVTTGTSSHGVSFIPVAPSLRPPSHKYIRRGRLRSVLDGRHTYATLAAILLRVAPHPAPAL